MRAIGMCVMLAFHAELAWGRGAFLALSQFFTLSGFLITSILLRRLERQDLSLASFWSRRYRRLMPASFAALALVVVFGATAANRVQVEALPGQVAAAALQVANWYFVVTGRSYFEIFVAPSPVQHFWSLAIEEQFYVVVPVAVVLLMRGTRSLLVTGAVLALSAIASTLWMAHLYEHGASLDRLYYGTDTRAAEMLVGATLAAILQLRPLKPGPLGRRVFGIVGSLAFGVSMWALTSVPLADGPMWTGGFLVFAVITATLIASILVGAGPAVWILRMRWLSAIGRITYGLYLYHWPIFLWLTAERTGLGPTALVGLRFGVTFAVSILSYRYLEMPIRNGANLGVKARFVPLLVPAAALAVIAAAVWVGDREVATRDPLMAAESEMPAATTDRDTVLDVLVVPDGESASLGAEIVALAERSPTLRASLASPFSCSRVIEAAEGPVCANWASQWPRLIEQHDPDVVLFDVAQWQTDRIAALAPAGLDRDQLSDWAATVLGNGISLLSARGATVVWNTRAGGDFRARRRLRNSPYRRAMGHLLNHRSDLRRAHHLVETEGVVLGSTPFPEPGADQLLANLRLYARAHPAETTRVLVVGDSVARTMGYGLELWAEETGAALVWTTATVGCGILSDGFVREMQFRESRVPPQCREIEAGWRMQIEAFDPDIVVVYSSVWDLQERRLDGWDDFRHPGDPEFDAYMLERYRSAVETLSSGGARIVWIQGPCAMKPGQSNATPTSDGPYDTDRLVHTNQVLLPRLRAEYPERVALFDLFPILCPEGEFAVGVEDVELVRPDGVHLSYEGSLWLARTQGAKILATE